MSNTSLLRQEASGVIYADPAKPAYTIRFRNTKANKTLNGVNTNNYACEVIYNDDNTVTIGGVSAVDAVSIRLRVSGAAESATRISAILTTLAAQVMTWDGQHVFQGFNPTTAPTVP